MVMFDQTNILYLTKQLVDQTNTNVSNDLFH